MTTDCVWCERTCPRCRYPISGGWEHLEQPQAPESRHVVCTLRRVVGPLTDVLGGYLEHSQHRLTLVEDSE